MGAVLERGGGVGEGVNGVCSPLDRAAWHRPQQQVWPHATTPQGWDRLVFSFLILVKSCFLNILSALLLL